MTSNIKDLFDSLDPSLTDEMLKGIYEISVPEGMKRRVKRSVYKKLDIREKSHRPYWIIPATAVIAAVIAVASIPDARAAVTNLFDRMFSIEYYMAQNTAERSPLTEIDALIQTPLPITSSSSVASDTGEDLPTAEFTNISSDAQFLKNVKVRIDETLYDGNSIIIMADLTGDIQHFYDEKTGGVMPDTKGGYIFFPGQLTFSDKDGKVQKAKCFAEFLAPKTYSEKYKGGENNSNIKLDSIKMVISADKLSLSGIQDVNIALTLRELVKIDKENGKLVPIGTCALKYSFDPSVGSDSFKTVSPNKTIDLKGTAIISEVSRKNSSMLVKNTSLPLDGCELKLYQVTKSPLGITIKVLYKCADGWTDLQKAAFYGGEGYCLGLKTIINGKDYSEFGSTGYDDTWRCAVTSIPILGNNQESIKSIEVIPFISYLTEVNGVRITSEQQKITIKDNGVEGGWSQEEDKTVLDNCKFTIDMP